MRRVECPAHRWSQVGGAARSPGLGAITLRRERPVRADDQLGRMAERKGSRLISGDPGHASRASTLAWVRSPLLPFILYVVLKPAATPSRPT
jgi:hypothetical protein